MFRSAMLAFIMSPLVLSAQSSVEALGRASDAGQRAFDQRNGQIASAAAGKVFKLKDVDEGPRYPGGDAALIDHLQNPAGCGVLPEMEDCIGTSKLKIEFVVNADGTMSGVEFAGEGCSALRGYVVCATRGAAVWEPAKLNGVPVRVRMQRTLRYDLR